MLEQIKNKTVDILNETNNWFQRNKTYIISGIGILLIATIAISGYITRSSYLKAEAYQLERDKYKDSILVLQDKTGDIVYKIKEKTIYEHSKEEKRIVDSLSKILLVKNKEISNYKEIISQTDFSKATGKIDTITLSSDSTYIYHYSYKDNFLEYKVDASKDSLHYNLFQVRDSLYILESKKTFKKKEYFDLTIKNLNPSVIITQAKSLSYNVPKEYSKISLGVHLGINPFNQEPTISIGLNYDILRFKKKIK